MKSKHKKYIMQHRNTQSAEDLAKRLHLDVAQVKKVLAGQKSPPSSPVPFRAIKTWFIAVLAIAIIIRIYLAFSTIGSYDAGLWEAHADQIRKIGLIEYYKISSTVQMKFNHPPFMGLFSALLLVLGEAVGLPFRVIFRLPFTALDFLGAFYILKIFEKDSKKMIYAAFYLLAPLTFIMSACHGNTDSAIGVAILAAIYYLSRGRYALAGLIFGFGLWIKWIILIVAPAIFFAIAGIRKKAKFSLMVFVMFLAGYALAFLIIPGVFFNNVFKYRGLMLLIKGEFLWGVRVFYDHFIQSYAMIANGAAAEALKSALDFYVKFNRECILIPIVLYAWLRRKSASAVELGKTVAVSFCIFYAITNFWGPQYFAWSCPFWVFLGLPWAIAITLVLSGYVYFLYAFVSGSLLLQGAWDIYNRSMVPGYVVFFRDLSILVCMGTSVYFFGQELIRIFRRKPDHGQSGQDA